MSAALHERPQIQDILMLPLAHLTLTYVTLNLDIPDKVELTIDVSM